MAIVQLSNKEMQAVFAGRVDDLNNARSVAWSLTGLDARKHPQLLMNGVSAVFKAASKALNVIYQQGLPELSIHDFDTALIAAEVTAILGDTKNTVSRDFIRPARVGI